MRRLCTILTTTLSVVTLSVVTTATATAYPPTPPGETTARQQLGELAVRSEGSMDGYDRDRFPHWSRQSGSCDTRETVLKRDGSGVSVGEDCYPTSGSWYSVYDGRWVDEPAEVHIDHVVPLAESWRSGTADWTDARREDFANDLDTQQLIAVSAESNLAKSDDDPAQWRPSNTGYHCVYARGWINVKHVWGLSVDPAEKNALSAMLDEC
ncbi:HNH endonuclease family protein [Actinopolyspora mortivallis]|uniref:HNH endonuclease family protein n=1 Tax=Actinopolyspora mortivallis TaxID=33906 RepID=UPI000379913D|nr:HNH endonuclease family protein [Actinopolyspora mortivallis]